MPIRRDIERTLRTAARQYPVVTVTGPRQSGKTTLCRQVFKRKPYVSLEPLDARDYARDDPRGFLAEYRHGAVIDEVQNAPDLLSYLQVEVDERPTPGRFVLTGSQHLGMLASVTQSLAGRVAVLHLLPLSLREVRRFGKPLADLWTTLWTGAYPAIHDRGLDADRWHANYVTTYVQRDVRQVLDVVDLEAFTTFARLCAGRTATEVNLSSIGSDAGVSHNTVRSWLSVLETSFLIFRVPAWHRSVRKQLVRRPKMHLIDPGLTCSLLGILGPEQLRHHPLRGAIFETWVAAEVLKARTNAGRDARCFHVRDAKGLEVDLLVERGPEVTLAEAKSGATVASSWLGPLHRLAEIVAAQPDVDAVDSVLVHGGEAGGRREGVRLLPWDRIVDGPWN